MRRQGSFGDGSPLVLLGNFVEGIHSYFSVSGGGLNMMTYDVLMYFIHVQDLNMVVFQWGR